MTKLAILFALSILALVVLADTSHLFFIERVYDFPYGDKIGHFVLFGTLSLLVCLATLNRTHRRRDVVVAAIALALIEGIEELSQAWFPSRTLDWRDAAASCAGIGVGALVAVWIKVRVEDREGQIDVIYGFRPARPGAIRRADGQGTLTDEEIEQVDRKLRSARILAVLAPLRRMNRARSARVSKFGPGRPPSP